MYFFVMKKKTFLIEYDENKLLALDAYCKAIWISRWELFRMCADNHLSLNIDLINQFYKNQSNYLIEYKDTNMFKLCMNSTVEKELDYLWVNQREVLKEIAYKLSEAGFKDESIRLIDIAHWQRYLQKNPKMQKTFPEYVKRKYTNPDLLTY
jgi:hypothetical protein